MVAVVARHNGYDLNGVGTMLVAHANRSDINSVLDVPGKIVRLCLTLLSVFLCYYIGWWRPGSYSVAFR